MSPFCLLLSLVFLSPADVTSSWPRFRGPNGTGHGSGMSWPKAWTQDAVRWKVELPGPGHGSPVIHSGRVYLQSSSRDGEHRLVYCLSAVDGKEIWRRELNGSRSAGGMHKKNSLASGTGATDGEVVCFCHWDGHALVLAGYACADGRPLWSLPIGDYESQHGAGNSPVMHQGKTIVFFDSDNRSEVLCVEAGSGKILWSRSRPVFKASYGTPLIRQAPSPSAPNNGGPGGPWEVVVASTAGIAGYDLESGAKSWEWVWRFAGKPLRGVSSPVLSGNDIVLAACGDGGGDRDTVALRLPGGPPTDHSAPALLWQLRRDIPYVPCLVAHDEHVYYVADKGVAGCLELRTGKTLWTQRLGGNFSSSPLVIDGRIVVVSEEGDLFVYSADPAAYRAIGRLRLGENVLATPALADGNLLVRGEQHLFCIGAAR